MASSHRRKRKTSARSEAGADPRLAAWHPSGHDNMPPRRRGLGWGVYILAIAAAVRCIYLWESSAGPTFYLPIIDSADYDNLARTLVDGGRANTSLFWQAVFYPLFLAAVYLASGSSILAAKLVQVAVGAMTCLLTYRLGCTVLDRRSGIIAGLVTALYGPLIFFETELLAAGWAAFWSVALVLVFLAAARFPRSLVNVALGTCGALSIITIPPFLPAVAGGCIWLALCWYRGPNGNLVSSVKGVVATLVGFLLIALPVSLLNQRLNGHFGFMPATGGINLYIGNNPDATTTISYRPGRDWTALYELPKRSGVTGGVWAEGKFFRDLAVDYLRRDPAGFVGGLLRKTAEFASSRELPRSVDIYVFRRWSHLLSVLVWKIDGFGFPFGILLPLALVGAVHRWKAIPAPIWLLLVLYSMSIILIFAAARYRIPLVPVLAVPAAAGCTVLLEAVRNRHWPRLLFGAALAAATAVAISLAGPFQQERLNYAAELHQFLGNRLFAEEKLDQAIVQYRNALNLAPEDPDIHGKLGEALLTLGRADEAARHFEASLRVRPESAVNHSLLGLAYFQSNDLTQAIEQYEAALRIDPDYAETRTNLGVALQQSGRIDEAIAAYREAARIKPNDATICQNLGAALAQTGDLRGAEAELSRALEINPDSAHTRYSLGVTLFRLGRTDEAIRQWQETLRIDPNYGEARARLAEAQNKRSPRL